MTNKKKYKICKASAAVIGIAGGLCIAGAFGAEQVAIPELLRQVLLGAFLIQYAYIYRKYSRLRYRMYEHIAYLETKKSA